MPNMRQCHSLLLNMTSCGLVEVLNMTLSLTLSLTPLLTLLRLVFVLGVLSVNGLGVHVTG